MTSSANNDNDDCDEYDANDNSVAYRRRGTMVPIKRSPTTYEEYCWWNEFFPSGWTIEG